MNSFLEKITQMFIKNPDTNKIKIKKLLQSNFR